MRNVELPANDRRRRLDGGMVERIAKGVSTDHSRRAHNYKACLIPRRNVHPQLRGAATAIIEAICLAGDMCAPLTSRRTADAPQTPTRRPPSRTCRDIVARRASSVAFHLRPLRDAPGSRFPRLLYRLSA